MSTATSNTRTTQVITDSTVQLDIDAAVNCHSTSKGKAAEAAAHIYMVWRATLSPGAEDTVRDWMAEQIASRNKEIIAHNQKVDITNKDLPKDQRLPRQMKVETKAKANLFTEVVKFVLDFRQPSEASLVSRYAAAVGWIHDKFRSETISDVTEITDAVRTLGGFEAAIAAFRNRNDKDGEGSAETKATASAKKTEEEELEAIILKTVRDAANINVSVQSYVASLDCDSGIVIALGRNNAGTIELVGTVPLPSEGSDDLLRLFASTLGPKMPAATRFLATVLDLACLVEQGRPSQYRENGIAAGQTLAEERVLALTSDALIVSARHADACVVLHAKPGPVVQLGRPTEPVFLEKTDTDRFSLSFANKSIRPLTTVRFTDAGDPNGFQWQVSRINKTDDYAWTAVNEKAHKPLMVDAFSPACSVNIDAKEVDRLLEKLKVWTTVKPDKVKKTVALTFEQGHVRYAMEGDETVLLGTTGEVLSPQQLLFRPKDLHALTGRLVSLPVAEFALAAGDRGTLRVSWSDDVGSYDIYPPTVEVMKTRFDAFVEQGFPILVAEENGRN